MPPKCSVCGKYHMGFCKDMTIYAILDEKEFRVRTLVDCFRFTYSVWKHARYSKNEHILRLSTQQKMFERKADYTL